MNNKDYIKFYDPTLKKAFFTRNYKVIKKNGLTIAQTISSAGTTCWMELRGKMADRGNIGVKGYDGIVYFYTHWRGSELKKILYDAITSPEGKARITDVTYFRTILFDKLTEGAQDKGNGFGISTDLRDNENDIIVVNIAHQTVTIGAEWVKGDRMTIEKFCQKMIAEEI